MTGPGPGPGPEVLLVNLPYAPVERPSLALGILKRVLEAEGIRAQVRYATFGFAEEIGLSLYSALSQVRQEMVGEWTFAGAAFPDHRPDHEAYLSRVAAHLVAGTAGSPQALIERLWRVRERTLAFLEREVEAALALGPRVVGCSSTFNQHCAALAFLRLLRERAPGIVTVLGGANCEGEMGLATAQAFPWVDFVVSGEAEESFPALCRQVLASGREVPEGALPFGVFGAPHRRPSARGPAAPRGREVPRALLADLDRSPAPDYRDYFEALAAYPQRDRLRPGLPLEWSRGCWWGAVQHCTFCGLNGASLGFRSKSPERALAELDGLRQEWGLDRLQLVDNILERGYFKTLVPRLAGREGPPSLFAEVKANLTFEQLQALKRAGFGWLQPGIESLHDRCLELMRKGTRAWINVQLLKWARELGISLTWNILCGFPGEEDAWYDEMAGWLPLISHLQPPGAGVRPIRMDRFSPHQADPGRYGLRLRPAWTYAYLYPLPEEELARLVYIFEPEGEDYLARAAQGAPLGGPGRDRLGRLAQAWIAAFEGPTPPLLCMTEEADRTRIVDTRAVAPARKVVLEGLLHRVHRACHGALGAEAVRARVDGDGGGAAPPEALQEALAELVERKLMIQLGGRWLALALPGEVPHLPTRLHDGFPGGWVEPARPQGPAAQVGGARGRVAR